MLTLALLIGFASEEADESGDRLADRVHAFFGDLGVGREDLSHYAYNIGSRHQQAFLSAVTSMGVLVAALRLLVSCSKVDRAVNG